MKKILITLLLLTLTSSAVYAAEEAFVSVDDSEEIKLETQIRKNDADVSSQSEPQEIVLEEKSLSEKLLDAYKLEVTRTDVPNPLLKEVLTKNFEKGPLESVHLWGALQMHGTYEMPEGSDSDLTYDVGLINILLDGKFKGGKEGFRIMLDPTPQNKRPFFQPFLQDAYIESKRIPHHTIIAGNQRPAVGVEGAQSPYTLPFISRSQISRNFGTIRKFGLRVKGDYDLISYDLGGYSSDTYWREFFPGVEFDGWVNLKPLAKTDGKYGKLTTGGGITAGQKGTDFFVAGAYIGYEYKRFSTCFEWAKANGYNGAAGLSTKHASGFYTTVAYKVTPKLQALFRYDQFDPDVTVDHNNKREYSAGLNYFIKGQALRLIVNYVFCQNDNKPDTHRIMLGSQILL